MNSRWMSLVLLCFAAKCIKTSWIFNFVVRPHGLCDVRIHDFNQLERNQFSGVWWGNQFWGVFGGLATFLIKKNKWINRINRIAFLKSDIIKLMHVFKVYRKVFTDKTLTNCYTTKHRDHSYCFTIFSFITIAFIFTVQQYLISILKINKTTICLLNS